MGPFLNWREGEPEFNALWPVFVFFLVGFLLLILLLKAALAQFSIEVTVLSNAVIGALRAAKAALVLDETPLRRVWCVTVGRRNCRQSALLWNYMSAAPIRGTGSGG